MTLPSSLVRAIGAALLSLGVAAASPAQRLTATEIAAMSVVPSPGSRVRVTVVDSNIALVKDWIRVGRLRLVEGTVVGPQPVEHAEVGVLLFEQDTMSFPMSSVVRLEVSQGWGFCRASASRPAACVALGIAGGALLGRTLAGKAATSLQVEPARERRYQINGLIIGGVIGAALSPLFALDRWKELPEWHRDTDGG